MQQNRELDPASRPRPLASRRRDKPQLSCNLCRRRKLRCDRRQPCSVCSARSIECVYVDNHAAVSSFTRPPLANSSVQDRIIHLERLVLSMMQKSNNDNRTENQTQPATPRTRAIKHVSSELGNLHMSASEHRYVGSDHWTAIMTSIADLKDHVGLGEQSGLSYTHQGQNNREEQLGDGTVEPHALLLFGHHHHASKAEIMSSLPPKNIVDQILTATMVLCSLLHVGDESLPQREEVISMLKNAQAIWLRSSPSSKEAERAGQIVKIVLEKAEDVRPRTGHPGTYPANEPLNQQEISMEHSSAVYATLNADEQSMNAQSRLGYNLSASTDNPPVSESQQPGLLGGFALPETQNLEYVFNSSLNQDLTMLDEWILSTHGMGWS